MRASFALPVDAVSERRMMPFTSSRLRASSAARASCKVLAREEQGVSEQVLKTLR